MTKQLKIIGKLLNLIPEVRMVWLEGMLDYIDITNQSELEEFVTGLYNYVAEHGTNNETISEFYNNWKTVTMTQMCLNGMTLWKL